MKFKCIKKAMLGVGVLTLGLTTLTSCDLESILEDLTTIIDENTNTNTTVDANVGVTYDDFQIHFMMLGNDKAGDSIYIKAGETDILIDAGSRSSSFETTSAYIDTYCTDNKLEYVIMTHGDQDHIDAFPKIFDKYDTGVIINNSYSNKTTATYAKVLNSINNEVTNGAKHYFASDCFNNTNGAKRSYELSDNVTMNIIYNKYYFEKGSDENDYSVCTLFTYKNGSDEHNFLLTGDLEEKGEQSIADYYDGSTADKTLPKVDLFKAGHHGSKTSSNDCLLDIIQPKMCVVSCCCGTDEYTDNIDNQFPTQKFIDRIAKWTDEVYVTTMCEDYLNYEGFCAMNGNIIVSAGVSENETKIGLSCSNNTTKLKDTEWFNAIITVDGATRQMRTTPENWK